jgi:hypothetical protein
MTEWSYTGAIDLFNGVSPKLSNSIQKSILDFNIAQSQYEIDRMAGGELFVALSKNESYPKRTTIRVFSNKLLMDTGKKLEIFKMLLLKLCKCNMH